MENKSNVLSSTLRDEPSGSDSNESEVEGQLKHSLYILRINKCRLYIGITDDVKRRLLEHKQSKGAKFTRYSDTIELVHTEELNSLQDAMKREKQLKGWTRAKKEALISGDIDLLKRL